jgi:hypothetical protein
MSYPHPLTTYAIWPKAELPVVLPLVVPMRVAVAPVLRVAVAAAVAVLPILVLPVEQAEQAVVVALVLPKARLAAWWVFEAVALPKQAQQEQPVPVALVVPMLAVSLVLVAAVLLVDRLSRQIAVDVFHIKDIRRIEDCRTAVQCSYERNAVQLACVLDVEYMGHVAKC